MKEIRDFAEQVLFSTRLEDKLRAPGELADENPGPAVPGVLVPGRPGELRFKTSRGGPSDFPGLHQLEGEAERGKLLHFFANHELLATELMALVLLRFPDAPAAFRRGVARTLQEEQEHTRMYLRRLADCGLEFGSLPVSGYFWRSVSGMRDPLDYVAGLSLTFEQANLDYARQFSQALAVVGDLESARLLDRIYRDEIAHVAYGLKWFRRWKRADLSDWEAYCAQLALPLSPQRAKGAIWNEEGRRAAGLDEQFIGRLRVFARSKGRTPDVYWFNLHSEAVMARGRAFTPSAHQNQIALDLCNLPQFLCRRDDVVLVPRIPSTGFLADLQAAGFDLPEFVPTHPAGEQRSPSPAGLADRKLGRLRPWAWGPDSLALLSPVITASMEDHARFHSPITDGWTALYSKAWSAAFLRELLAALPPAPWVCTEKAVGQEADSVEGVLRIVQCIRAQGHHRVVVKQCLGLAGGNALRLWEPGITTPQMRWIERSLQGGRTLVVEPWLDRIADFSIQCEMAASELRILGYTGLNTDLRGQYQANWATSQSGRRIPPSLIASIVEPRDVTASIHKFLQEACSRLGARLGQAGYQGPVGIDSFVYRDSDGRCRLKPVVEINPRYTMGRVTLELMRRVAPGSVGTFRLINQGTSRTEGFSSFPEHALKLSQQLPVVLEGHPEARIAEGNVCLNDPSSTKACLAVFTVQRRQERRVVGH